MTLKLQIQMSLLRLIDIFFSLILLLTLFPFYLIISLFVFIDGLPIIYVSNRVGKNGIIFKMYKFRSMKVDKSKKLKDSERLNKLGIFLRRTSLDELPQLINILRGHMSLVGPRSLPIAIEKKIPKKYINLRRSINPGITGLSQINYSGKNRSLREKINFDVMYIKNISIFNYFKIIFMTLFVIIRRYKNNKKGLSL